jgi:cytochrome c oxidase assembly factor CtaG
MIGAGAVATIAYARLVGRRGRPGLFVAAMVLLAIAFLSPLNLLAQGVLFSAHMAQHIILLLLVPGLVWLSLEHGFPGRGGPPGRPGFPVLQANAALEPGNSGPLGDRPLPHSLEGSVQKGPILTWFLGVGSMWFWHVPVMCNAAAASTTVHTLQTVSLLGLGAAFWWPILSPTPAARLTPGWGILYLFSACLACTGLGVLLTITPVEVCPIFSAPSSAAPMWVGLRDRLTAVRDQQIGGLLMWMPMCLVYVAAIVLELARWLGAAEERRAAIANLHPNAWPGTQGRPEVGPYL